MATDEPPSAVSAARSEIEAEQRHIDRAYQRLRSMEERAKEVAAAAAANPAAAGPLRDAIVNTGLERAARLNIGDEALVFGRLDTTDAHVHHIGRVAVYDEHHDPLVIDWRAPVAEPFYRATPADPQGVVRRRHISTRGQTVVSLEDELLDASEGTEGLVVVGEGALFEAMGRSRTGRMRDIVATIQREQDEVIRAPLEGVLLVQGGPGTGKTAVGLHRAAFLLYQHREKLERAGVLVIGPNPVFIRYIDRVLPALGESASMTTAAELVPGLVADTVDDVEVARIKGDVRMAEVIERGVADLERGSPHDIVIPYDGREIVFSSRASRHMAKLVRKRLRGTHNDKRSGVREILLDYLYARWRGRSKEWADLVGEQQRRAFTEEVSEHPAFLKALDETWPAITAAGLVRRLLRDPQALASAAEGILSPEEQRLLSASSEEGFTEADVALVDEAAPLVGPLHRPRRRTAAVDEEERWAIERLLDDLEASDPLVGAERRMLSERLMQQRLALESDGTPRRERDRFGHVVIDEAQALSPMQWRMIARRCPSRSMTILGDLGQAGGAWAPRTWDEVISLLRPRTWKIAELTLNYRTPAEIAELAERVLAEAAPALKPPTSVRHTGEHPEMVEVPAEAVVRETVDRARSESALLEDGRVGVIAAAELVDDLRRELGAEGNTAQQILDQPIAVLDVDRARGLEFDSVVVVEPDAISASHPGGLRAIYVALTRPTKRLVVVHSGPLPAPLRRQRPGDDGPEQH